MTVQTISKAILSLTLLLMSPLANAQVLIEQNVLGMDLGTSREKVSSRRPFGIGGSGGGSYSSDGISLGDPNASASYTNVRSETRFTVGGVVDHFQVRKVGSHLVLMDEVGAGASGSLGQYKNKFTLSLQTTANYPYGGGGDGAGAGGYGYGTTSSSEHTIASDGLQTSKQGQLHAGAGAGYLIGSCGAFGMTHVVGERQDVSALYDDKLTSGTVTYEAGAICVKDGKMMSVARTSTGQRSTDRNADESAGIFSASESYHGSGMKAEIRSPSLKFTSAFEKGRITNQTFDFGGGPVLLGYPERDVVSGSLSLRYQLRNNLAVQGDASVRRDNIKPVFTMTEDSVTKGSLKAKVILGL